MIPNIPSQKNAKVVSIDSYEDVPANDEEALKKAVAHQPVSVAIEASGLALQLYQSVSKLFSHTHVSNCILPFINCDNWTHFIELFRVYSLANVALLSTMASSPLDMVKRMELIIGL